MTQTTREHFNLLCSIGDLAALLSGSQDIQSFLQRTVELVSRHLKADVCSIYLSDESSGDLILQATLGLNPEAVGHVRMKPGEGLVGTTFDTLRPIREAHASCNPHFKYFEEADEDRFESFLAVPIQRGVQRIGVLVVQHETPDYFTETDVMALRASASQLASAVENVRLLIDLYEATGRTPPPTVPLETPAFIKGRIAAGGFAFGPARFLRKSHTALLAGDSRNCRRLTAADFHAAVRRTADQLMDLQSRLAERLPESASLIFTAHFMILKDPKFIQKVVKAIEGGAAPPDAVRAVARHYIGMFSASGHAYIREKASDMEDLAGRILKNMLRDPSDEPAEEGGGIVVASELYPSEILKLASEDVAGFVLAKGGVTSHVSILARSLKIPMLIADWPGILDLAEETPLLLDGRIGNIYINPDEGVIQQFEAHREARRKAAAAPRSVCPITRTADGVRIRLMANINLLSELKTARHLNAEGVGLYRTEFPFLVRPTFPSEEEQYVIYRRLFQEMAGREVTIRTLDVGGDKALVYANGTAGANPDLGLRSIRFSLHHRTVFEGQIRAILRAAAESETVRIMFPMISSVDEFRKARSAVDEWREMLRAEGLPHHPNPAVGMMVEVPSVVELMEAFCREADFFSIGTNDFVQYTLAVDRGNERVAGYYLPHHPAVLRGLARIVRAAVARDRDVAVCGEMAHELQFIPYLLGIGIRTLSVDPQYLPMVQERIANLRIGRAEDHVAALLAEDTVAGTAKLLEERAGMC
jgi:phosphotransferase system enzyme I (PtsP)